MQTDICYSRKNNKTPQREKITRDMSSAEHGNRNNFPVEIPHLERLWQFALEALSLGK